jgi:hypothetical protein
MTDQFTTNQAGGTSPGKADQAKEVAGQAVERAQEVAGHATDQAKAVVRDARQQVRGLVDRTRQNIDQEAGVRSRQAAGSLRSFADQLGALADGSVSGAGELGDYARQAGERISRLAERLEDGPNAVLDDVRRFARRQPGLFLAAAGAAGFVAGRLLRAGRDGANQSDTGDNGGITMPPITSPVGMPPPEALSVSPDVSQVGTVGAPAAEGLAP